jgi:flagellar protein FlbD
MIRLTRLNGSEMFLNADLISTVESHPDTVITLVDGKHFVVAETGMEVVERIAHYRADVLALAERAGTTAPPQEQTAQLYLLQHEPKE